MPAGLAAAALTARAGVAPGDVPATIERLRAAGLVDDIQGVLFAPGLARGAGRSACRRSCASYHTAHPLSEGLAREEARERLFAHAAPVLFDQVLADLAAAGRVTGRERLAGAGHAVSLSPREAEARDMIERELRDGRPQTGGAGRHRRGARDRCGRQRPRARAAGAAEGGGEDRRRVLPPGGARRLKEDVRALKRRGRMRAWTWRPSRSATASPGSSRFRCSSTWTGNV